MPWLRPSSSSGGMTAVTNPGGTSTNNAVARWVGGSGTKLSDSSVFVDDSGAVTDSFGPISSVVSVIFDTGFETGGAVIKSGGLDISVPLGTGYVHYGVDNTYLLVSWLTTPLSLTPNSVSYIYVQDSGIVSTSSTQPDLTTNILLSVAVTNATDVVFLSTRHVNLSGRFVSTAEYFREVIGPIAVDGLLAEEGTTPLHLNVDAGDYYIADNRRTSASGIDITFVYWYRDALGDWVPVPGISAVSTAFYDDGSGVLAAIPPGRWKKDVFLIAVSGSGTEYHVVYGQETFASQGAAESGNLPSLPDWLRELAIRSTGIVVQQGSVSIGSMVDARPILGQNVSQTLVTAHGLLSGLLNNDHPQYLLRDGSNAMTADLDMGGFDLTNVGLVDGRDVASDGTDLDNHIADMANPHAVTAFQVGAQPLDADLTAIAALGATGIAVRSAADTWVQRQVTAPVAGITITNPAGVAGDITLVLADDLAALESLGSTGIAVRSAADTWVQRQIDAPRFWAYGYQPCRYCW